MTLQKLLNLLPETLHDGHGALSESGWLALLLVWALLFVVVGLFIGSLYWRKARRSVISLERENEKGFNRLAIYRATVEKQAESEFIKN